MSCVCLERREVGGEGRGFLQKKFTPQGGPWRGQYVKVAAAIRSLHTIQCLVLPPFLLKKLKLLFILL
jgi:hypothetical protein